MPTQSDASTCEWLLYLLECRNGALYAGITNDMQSRWKAHVSGRGARYTRANPPVRIVATCGFADRSSASSAEWFIKQVPRQRKIVHLINIGGKLCAA